MKSPIDRKPSPYNIEQGVPDKRRPPLFPPIKGIYQFFYTKENLIDSDFARVKYQP